MISPEVPTFLPRSSGVAWQPLATAGTGHTFKTNYGTNTSTCLHAIRLWTVVKNGASSTTKYAAGKLYRTTLRDENNVNTTACTGSIDEYTDFEDRVVLKSVWEIESKAFSTHYVYDDFSDATNKSNRLLSVTGTFTYDLNGNATKDRTGMLFTYNQLNLPKTSVGADRSISYQYDAMGTKLKKQATVGGIVTDQDYIGGIEYSRVGSAASTIERIATEEGFVLNSGGTYSYHYNLTDHLGNVRSVIKREGSATVPSIVQRQDYYPFGKTKSIATSVNNRKSVAMSSFVPIKNKLIIQIISIFIMVRKPFRVHQNR